MTAFSPPRARSLASLIGTPVPVHIVDVGANAIDGVPPYASLLRNGATLTGFEPNPDALARLQRVKRDNETYLPHAIGDGHSHTLHLCAAEGMTSLFRPNPAVINLFHGFPLWSTVKETCVIETVRLDDVPEARFADLLKIDIQGGELMAMQNATAMLENVLVVQTEVEFLPLYIDQPLFSDIDLFLRARGFILHRFFPTVSRTISPMLQNNDIYAGMSQLVWADAIFVRDFTRLDLLSDGQLLTSAAILHDCYNSFDLVFHFLNEHDERSRTSFAPAYLSGLQAQAALGG
jgi:FkbM family methyltransferase